MTVRHVAGVVDVERDPRRRHCVGGHPLVDERIGQADHVLQPRRVFEPRQGRLGTQVAPVVGQPSAGELERRVAAQHVEVVGVLVAAADRKRPGPDHVGDRMGDARAIAPIGKAARQALRHPQAPLRHRQQHHPAVRRKPAAIKRGCDFLGNEDATREDTRVSFPISMSGKSSRHAPPEESVTLSTSPIAFNRLRSCRCAP
jgi:hypothetical protein